jgi:lysophospholipase L1-like esterase
MSEACWIDSAKVPLARADEDLASSHQLGTMWRSSCLTVAAKNQAQLVDVDAVFSARDRTRLFWDTMHPSERGHVLVADTVAGEVKQLIK